MSFDIFAAGTNNFYYKRKGCEDGSTFKAMDIITTLQGLDVSSLNAAAKGYAYSKIDSISEPKSIVDAMFYMAKQEMLHNLSNAVCFLAMKNTEGGWIYVNATETHALWADTVRSAKYQFSPGDSPGAEFVGKIANCLKDTSMDNWGVLRQLSIALSNFSNDIDDSMTPMINITLTN